MFSKMILLIFVVFTFCACAPGDQAMSNGASDINVWHDNTRAVTCWIYQNAVTKTGGISCLPDSEVKNVR